MRSASLRALKKAVSIAGTQTELASRITKHVRGRRGPVWQYHVWSWLNRDKRVPDWAVLAIEAATLGEVKRHELRPDLYPREESAA